MGALGFRYWAPFRYGSVEWPCLGWLVDGIAPKVVLMGCLNDALTSVSPANDNCLVTI